MKETFFSFRHAMAGLTVLPMLVFLLLCVSACKDDDDTAELAPFNPSRQVVVNDFSPKDGGVNQKLVIFGDNNTDLRPFLCIFIDRERRRR